MTNKRPEYLLKEKNRHRKTVWYVRKGTGPRIRIRGVYGSPEFKAQYDAAIGGNVAEAKKAATVSEKATLRWLINEYENSGAFREELKPATQKQRQNIFKHVVDGAGDEAFAEIGKADIRDGIEKRVKAGTSAQAVNFLKAMRGLFRWAVANGHVGNDPTEAVKGPKLKKGDGFHMWTEDELAAFEDRWAIGTRQRLAYSIMRFTGLRRGDVYKFGPRHIRNGVLKITTEKNEVDVIMPVLPELRAVIDASPIGHSTFVARLDGKPYTKESFGNWFHDACVDAGLPHCNCHGVRKAVATEAAENEATESQLNAIFGWTDPKMAAHYTKKANRARLASGGIEKLRRVEIGVANPAPFSEVPRTFLDSEENQALTVVKMPYGAQERTKGT